MTTPGAAFPTLATPTFHIPENIDISISSKFVRNGFYTLNSKKYRIGSAVSGSMNDLGNMILNTTVKMEETYEGTIVATMSNAITRWYVQYNYSAAGCASYLYYFNISYQ